VTVLRVEMTVEVVVEELMEAKKSFGFLPFFSAAVKQIKAAITRIDLKLIILTMELTFFYVNNEF